jgi:hypothetical protein
LDFLAASRDERSLRGEKNKLRHEVSRLGGDNDDGDDAKADTRLSK